MQSLFCHRRALKLAGQGASFALLVGFGSLAHGQGYSTTISLTNGYTKNDSLSGQQNWDTNDPFTGNTVLTSTNGNDDGSYIGQTDAVVGTVPPGANNNDLYAANGGIYQGSFVPGHSTVNVFHAANTEGANSFTLNSDAFLSASFGTQFTNTDSFGYSFLNAAGNTTLFSVDFVPSAVSPGTAPDQIEYTINGVQHLTTGLLYLGGYFHLTANVDVQHNTFGFTVTETGLPMTDVNAGATQAAVTLTGVNAANVGNAGTYWSLTDKTADTSGGYDNGGDNALYFKTFTVTVPEPSTYAMLGLGVLGLAARFRRKSRA